MANFRLIFFYFIISTFWGCMSKQMSENSVFIQISTPNNCEYKISLNENKIVSRSFSFTYKTIDDKILKIDTLQITHDTIISQEALDSVKLLLKNIKNEISNKNGKDLYRYILAVDNVTKIDINYNNKDISNIIRAIRPFINTKKIVCNDFFVIFDEVDQ